MSTVFLVRHAVTAQTSTKLVGRTAGVHLSDRGVEQAEVVAERLTTAKLTALYSSPLERALETAQVIGRRVGLEAQARDGLNEIEYGSYTNRSFATLRRTKLWSRLERWPSAVRFPGGENLREAQARSVDEIESLCVRHPKEFICCVTHADVVRLAVAHYLGLHIDLFQRIVVAPASLSVISLNGDVPRVVTLNSVS